MASQKIVLIIDGFSTGRYFAPLLKKRGYQSIHLQSTPEIPGFLLKGFCKEDYIEHLVFDGNITTLVSHLKSRNILAIFAGTETAIYLTDKLSEELRLTGNSSQSSTLRRDKFSMIDAVRAGGLGTANQFKSNDMDKILQWSTLEAQYGWPLVVKPINSAGTDGVRFCYNSEDIISAVENILGKKNKLGILNNEVLIQSFLDGEEYIVNTVSHNSRHNLTDIRLCHKKKVMGAGYVSGCEELIPADMQISQELKAYAFRALDCLEVVNGPGHFEIMYTKEGPKIIEMGARLQGGINPDSNTACLGYHQIDKTIDAYLEPDRFLSYFKQDYTLQKCGIWMFLISERTGKILSIPFIEKVKALSSFFSLQMNVQVNDVLLRTVDYYSSPGSVHLVNQDSTCLKEDMALLRELEKEAFVLSKAEHVI